MHYLWNRACFHLIAMENDKPAGYADKLDHKYFCIGCHRKSRTLVEPDADTPEGKRNDTFS